MVHSWPLVGRKEELSVIAGALTSSGEQRGLVLAGAPGVGKSRLAREAVTVAARMGWVVRWVTGTVTARTIPLGAFAAFTDGLDGNPLALVRQVIGAITTTNDQAPVLMAVDDLHLLDDLSAFVLHQLVLQRGAWVIGTLRSGQSVPDAVSALWKDEHLRRLEVQALSRAETDELLTAALAGTLKPAVGERMWRLSAGNALFLRELVEQERAAGRLARREDAWHWDGPVHVSTSLVDLVELQMGSISDAVGEVLDMVIVGDPLERSTLVATVEPNALQQAEQRGLITALGSGDTDTVHIGHPLYAEVRLAKCGHMRLRRLRGRLATALSAGAASDTVRLGLLWLHSDLPPVPDVFLAGAHAAFLRLDLENAQRLAEAAVTAGAGIPAQLLLAHALTLLNRGTDAAAILESFRADDLPEPVWSQVIHARAANLMWPLGRPEQSWATIDDALADGSGQLAAELLCFRALQLSFAARPAEALPVTESTDLAAVSAPAALVGAWGQVIALGDLGRPDEAAAAAAVGYGRAATAPEAAYPGVGLTEFHVMALLLAGDIAGATAAADQTYRVCAHVPGISRSVAMAVTGMAALGAGDLAAASARLTPAVEDFTAYSDQTGVFYRFAVVFVEVLARSGRVGEAQAQLERMSASRHPAFVFIESDALLARAWVQAAAGRMGQARHLAARAAEFARDHCQWAREVWCLQTSVGFGDTTVGARLADLTKMVGGPRAPTAARYAAALAGADGPALAAVSEQFEAFGDRLAAAEAAAHAATAFNTAGRRGSALTADHRADRLAAECGMVLRPGLRTAALPLKLSGHEREITVLLAQGLSNKAIAEALTMSVRSVEAHIYRACSRLGLSRTELTKLAAEHHTGEEIA